MTETENGMETEMESGSTPAATLLTDFLAIYPQFSALPQAVLRFAADDATARFSDLDDVSRARARHLYMAHVLTMWCRSALPPGASPAELANAGDPQLMTSHSVGGDSVSRHESAALNSIGGFAEWKQTVYGLSLITLCMAESGGTVYVP